MAVKIIKKKAQPKATATPAPKKPPREYKGITAFTSLRRALGPERMAMVSEWLRERKTARSVAQTIKSEWGLMANTKLLVLERTLNRYRHDVLDPQLHYVASPDAKKVALFAEKVDVLENLIKLVELQQERVSKGMAQEQKWQGLNPLLKFEVQTLGGLYKQLSDLRFDMGLIRKVPAKFQVEGMATRTQQLLEEAMKKSERVDEALSKAFAVLEGKFTVEKDDDAPARKH